MLLAGLGNGLAILRGVDGNVTLSEGGTRMPSGTETLALRAPHRIDDWWAVTNPPHHGRWEKHEGMMRRAGTGGRPMVRTRIRPDETIDRLARQRAFVEGIPFTSLVHNALELYLMRESRKPLTIEDLGFAGIGSSQQGDSSPVSERHDEALAEAAPD